MSKDIAVWLHSTTSCVESSGMFEWMSIALWTFFLNSDFANFRVCLDSEMKRLQKLDMDKKSEPLTAEEDELLWKEGLLGKESPQTLVDTILVMNGIYIE